MTCLHASPEWNSPLIRTTRIALRLASFHFPHSAELVAQFYEVIADEATLSAVKQNLDADSRREDIGNYLIRFRVITASVCLAIVGRIAGDGYNSLQHSTRLHLRNNRPLKRLSEDVDQLASSGLSLPDVVIGIAAIHCAKTPYVKERLMQEVDSDHEAFYASLTIGCRNGVFAVLPKLLFSMSSPISVSLLGLQCADTFIGNLPVTTDGFIRSLRDGNIAERDTKIFQTLSQAQSHDDEAQLSLPANNNVYLGPPTLRLPDTPLYLSIERPLDQNEPLLGLAGRINGELIGNVGIECVLTSLLLSLENKIDTIKSDSTCAEHAASSSQLKMLNVPASVWGHSGSKPSGEPYVRTYLPVQGDSAWAIFLAGEGNCRIAFGCALCAVKGSVMEAEYFGNDPGSVDVVIGY